jgi:U2 small nuclear ribonucleoprotein A'
MRISSELVGLSPSILNPLGHLELDLRGNNIDTIENLSVIKDFYHTIDFSDNRISKLENFPKVHNLVEIYLCNNKISSIDLELGKRVVNLKVLNLQNNNISKVEEIRSLKYCNKLEQLILIGNPLADVPNYKQTVLSLLPGLKILDFQYVQTSNTSNLEAGKVSKENIESLLELANTTTDINFLLSIEKQI